eukprot:11578617-Ditylum_brightwellii.AAC.1
MWASPFHPSPRHHRDYRVRDTGRHQVPCTTCRMLVHHMRHPGLLVNAPCDIAIESSAPLFLETAQLVFHGVNQGQQSNARQWSNDMSAQ